MSTYNQPDPSQGEDEHELQPGKFLIKFKGLSVPFWGVEPDYPKYKFSTIEVLDVFDIAEPYRGQPLDLLIRAAEEGYLARAKK